jgi:uncharacterized protein
VSMARSDTSLGDGGKPELTRAIRRHGNIAENAGVFIAGLTLLELSGKAPSVLFWLCVAFVVVRLFHAAGLSRENTANPLRTIGGVGTYLVGLVLGAMLIWVALPMLLAGHV